MKWSHIRRDCRRLPYSQILPERMGQKLCLHCSLFSRNTYRARNDVLEIPSLPSAHPCPPSTRWSCLQNSSVHVICKWPMAHNLTSIYLCVSSLPSVLSCFFNEYTIYWAFTICHPLGIQHWTRPVGPACPQGAILYTPDHEHLTLWSLRASATT